MKAASIILAAVVALVGVGVAVKPASAVYRWNIEAGQPGTAEDYLSQANEIVGRYYWARSLPTVSYTYEGQRKGEGITTICKEVHIIQPRTIFGIGMGRMWIGCGGAESGFY